MATLCQLVDTILKRVRGREYYSFLAEAVLFWRPHRVLELGTGAGHSAAAMMPSLPAGSTLTTVNWPNPPSGDPVGVQLAPWAGDPRLRMILGDTREVRGQVDGGVDFLVIDSGTEHTYSLISAEWALYESALADRAVVVLHDIFVNDMPRFWDEVKYEKEVVLHSDPGLGVFRYVR